MYRYFIILFLLASAFDLTSTLIVADGWFHEENPLLRYLWKEVGLIGFIGGKVLTTILILSVVHLLKNNKIKISVLTIMIVANLAVALTNLGYLPYFLLSWLPY